TAFSPDGQGTKIASRLSKQKGPATLSSHRIPGSHSIPGSRSTPSKPDHLYETERIDGVASEKAVLVRVILPGQVVGDDPLDEITGLAETAGARRGGSEDCLCDAR